MSDFLTKIAKNKKISKAFRDATQNATKRAPISGPTPIAPSIASGVNPVSNQVPNYSNMSAKEVWNKTKTMGAAELGNLSLKDKVRALAGQAQSAKWDPKSIGRAAWKNLGEAGGGGGYSAGSGTLARHIPMGAKLTVASMGIPAIASGFSKEDAEGKGRSRVERLAGGIGYTAGSMLGYLPHSVNRYLGGYAAPLAIGTSMLTAGLGQKAGEFVGRNIDKGVSKLRGVGTGDVMAQKFQAYKQQQAQQVPQQTPQQQTPSGAM